MGSQPFFKRTNDAIHANGDHYVNGAVSDIAITNHGSDWYWVSKHLAVFSFNMSQPDPF